MSKTTVIAGAPIASIVACPSALMEAPLIQVDP